jgi:acetylornithine deacetylase/succinyl-diaminopimelate desuccinylase-like protein
LSLLVTAAAGFEMVALLNRNPSMGSGERWILSDYAHLPEVKLLQQYVQIDTSAATGNEVRGAEFLAAQLATAGIASEIEHIDGRHASLYARVEGADPHALVLHHHIDVKDVDPKEWFSPPFEARLELPWMYGRGVFDMKSVAIAQLLALIEIKKSGKPLRRSVVFLATGDEETGSTLGAAWFIRQHPDRVKQFWALLTEGGTVEARTRSDIKYWGTEIGQKHFADLWICSADRARLDDLRDAMLERGYAETNLTLIPAVQQVLTQYGATRDRADLKQIVADPRHLLADIASFRLLPPYVRSMLRDEAVPFRPEAAPGGGWQMLVKFHLLPGHHLEDVRNDLLPPSLLQGLSAAYGEVGPDGTPSPTDHPVFLEIERAIHHDYPEAVAGPFFLPWTATDSRFFRAAGVPSYGFSPFVIMSTDTLQVDQANERMSMTGFAQGVALYRELLERLLL